MRKIIIVVLALIAIMGVMSIVTYKREPDYVATLREQVNSYPLTSYTDRMFGYTICYPYFFVRDEASSDDANGYSLFVFNDIMIEAYAARKPHDMPMGHSMKLIAERSHADTVSRDSTSLVISGDVFNDEGKKLRGMRYHSKYVNINNLWFAYTIYYPIGCETALQRIIHTISSWQPYKDADMDRMRKEGA